MRIPVHGINNDCLRLGIQTNAGNVVNHAAFLVKAWAPRKAQSYKASIRHTDYHGKQAERETGYATMVVEYFTGYNEYGSIPLTSV